jgi:hypothetical protein
MVVNYVAAPTVLRGSGEAAEGFVDANTKFVDTETKSPLPPTVLRESENCNTFNDLANTTQEFQTYIIQACELGLMGIRSDGTPLSAFMPNKKISRAEFGTVLSRLLYGTLYNS